MDRGRKQNESRARGGGVQVRKGPPTIVLFTQPSIHFYAHAPDRTSNGSPTTGQTSPRLTTRLSGIRYPVQLTSPAWELQGLTYMSSRTCDEQRNER